MATVETAEMQLTKYVKLMIAGNQAWVVTEYPETEKKVGAAHQFDLSNRVANIELQKKTSNVVRIDYTLKPHNKVKSMIIEIKGETLVIHR